MKTVARVRNPADAAFLRSLLESEGIAAAIVTDGGMEIGGDIHLRVDDEAFAAAAEIVAQYEKDAPARADLVEQTHPAKDFPFRKVWAFAALFSFVVYDGGMVMAMMADRRLRPDMDSTEWGAILFNFIASPVMYSLLLTVLCAIGWVSWRMLRRRPPNKSA